MANNQIREIRYLNKDFNTFRQSLIDFAKVYFPNTFNDYDSSDPAMMFIEMAAYVGDVLSYYMDSQLKESMLIYAEEKKNVVALAQSLGYKPKPTVPATTKLEVYQLIPSIGTGEDVVPDWNYALRIEENMMVASVENSSNLFKTLSEINFSFSSSYDPTYVSIYQTDTNGVPTLYLLKKYVDVESSTQTTTTFTFTDPIKYNKVLIGDKNVVSIDEVMDSEGNIWYEVPYLAQDTIFEAVENVAANDPYLSSFGNQTPYLLKYKRVSRRFITRYRSDGSLELQFGAGTTSVPDEEIIPNPDNVGLALPGHMSRLNETWDIANFLYSDTYGLVPSNTTLTVKYSVGGGLASNARANTITAVSTYSYTFNGSGLDANLKNMVVQSLACNNPDSATGGRNEETVEEIRNNALAYFAAQGRTVTKEDYMLRAYSMPQKFGSIAKAYIVQDEQLSFTDLMTGLYQTNERILNPLAMNLYILSYDSGKNLVHANQAIKENLKVYLDRHRLLTDAINIKNAYVINISLAYTITVLPTYSAKEVLLKCTAKLKEFFDIEKWQINQPIILNNIITTLANIDGVQSVIDVSVHNLYDDDQGYWPNVYDIQAATRDGIIYPSMDPSIFELKYPDINIVGKVRGY